MSVSLLVLCAYLTRTRTTHAHDIHAHTHSDPPTHLPTHSPAHTLQYTGSSEGLLPVPARFLSAPSLDSAGSSTDSLARVSGRVPAAVSVSPILGAPSSSATAEPRVPPNHKFFGFADGMRMLRWVFPQYLLSLHRFFLHFVCVHTYVAGVLSTRGLVFHTAFFLET